jgi:radical SAM superfamily enzyme YgiQ (UPF0313 family)
MSNLGFHSLFHSVSSFHGVRVARFFLERNSRLFSPEAADPRRRDLVGKEGGLKSFDAIFFTVSFELDYLNILKMLSLFSLPLRAGERERKIPLVVCGGIAPTANPLVLSVLADVVFLGDMEGRIELIVETLFRFKFGRSASLFESLQRIEGVSLSQDKAVKRARSIQNPIVRPAHTVVITNQTEFAGMFLIEIVRGCKNRCSFCMTRCAAQPARPAPIEAVLEYVNRASTFTKKIGLVGPVLTDHPELPEMVERINAIGGVVSFSSLRADHFTEEIASLLKRNNQKSVTFAPETGSERLRRKIRKNLSNDQILEAVSRALSHGVKKIRYYLMYGLPGEETQDIVDIPVLIKETLRLFRSSGREKPSGRLFLSINPFIPKSGTPLASARPRAMEYYRKAQDFLRKQFSDQREVEIRFETLRQFYVHCILSTGDRETGIRLVHAFEQRTLEKFSKYAEERMLHG